MSSTASTRRPATSGPSIRRCRPCALPALRTTNASSGLPPGGRRVHHRGGHRVGAQRQPADGLVLQVRGRRRASPGPRAERCGRSGARGASRCTNSPAAPRTARSRRARPRACVSPAAVPRDHSQHASLGQRPGRGAGGRTRAGRPGSAAPAPDQARSRAAAQALRPAWPGRRRHGAASPTCRARSRPAGGTAYRPARPARRRPPRCRRARERPEPTSAARSRAVRPRPAARHPVSRPARRLARGRADRGQAGGDEPAERAPPRAGNVDHPGDLAPDAVQRPGGQVAGVGQPDRPARVAGDEHPPAPGQPAQPPRQPADVIVRPRDQAGPHDQVPAGECRRRCSFGTRFERTVAQRLHVAGGVGRALEGGRFLIHRLSGQAGVHRQARYIGVMTRVAG